MVGLVVNAVRQREERVEEVKAIRWLDEWMIEDRSWKGE